MADVPEIGAEEAEELTDALLLDVREAEEWNAGHAPTATWIPMGDLQARVRQPASDQISCAHERRRREAPADRARLLGRSFETLTSLSCRH